ncbi:hypothetical protein S7711_00157 [Stachybotrys chartarum IBT 7711]|uniref:HTH APSES-type domain-containing protein n=1 Tax=Stachybotrys chartarum (strain CBS 109288 / IBT 7711) TaxID=1280523 RepID=A0A084B3L8_STACB|nr:hypothetical protein S7711_00157 [Stachybotrys chartarum IBT 7711]KFA52257.1 hypothetical protein S40293_00554 [Stachybotrys chartarum IBT 40293]KFA77298.1 hypothetical protein S40288_01295 [Stachybotrys chartarum IBT 40288]
MVKGVAAVAAGPGIYSATYSGIPVYEFQFGQDLKEHVMRRRQDDWINATHILKAAGFDKPARTRILERDVQKDRHEKIQGGYGKYQGTWIPLPAGESLAQRHNVYDRLKEIFTFVPGNESPPPAPRHASKPKASKAKPPPPPKWNGVPVVAPVHEEYINGDSIMGDDDIPDNLTTASAPLVDEDRYDLSHMSTGHRKRKRDDETEQQHALYGDELLDYFLLSRNEQPAVKPDPPPNFQPNWPIDAENHTALHWASSMGDVDIIKQVKRFSADVAVKNIRGETPLMRSVNFTNCYDKQTFPAVIKELLETAHARDNSGCTIIHHAAIMKNSRAFSASCSRYYLDIILNKLQETLDPSSFQQLIDAQDNDGNTAVHLAAQRNARKCIRALLGRGASTDIANNEGARSEDMIQELNAKKKDRVQQRSSSPFAPDSQRHNAFRDAYVDKLALKPPVSLKSAAANMVQSRITPLILEKFQDLAKRYDEEWQEREMAEIEARRILNNTQADLASVLQQIGEVQAMLEPDEVAAKVINDANLVKHSVLSLFSARARLGVQESVDAELNRANGDAGADKTQYEDRLALAQRLSQLLVEQRQVENDYVEALSLMGVGDKIDKYRKLLKRCLDPKEGESLDHNLDSLIDMMEEQKDVHHNPDVSADDDVDFAMSM